jgi:hypothetical protein
VRLNTEAFISQSKKKHGDLFGYDLVDYVNSTTKVKIRCRDHGVFLQSPKKHLLHGCTKCAHEGVGNRFRRDVSDFINTSNDVHNNKYDYSQVVYVNCETHVVIICPDHGSFKKTPTLHLLGSGCNICSKIEKSKYYRVVNGADFVHRANNVHAHLYDYSLIDYIDAKTNVNIICRDHGIFRQTPDNHLSGSRCPECSSGGGYSTMKPGRLYYVMFDFGQIILYKIGITNNTVKRRFRGECVKPVTLWETTFSDGKIPPKLEREILNKYSQYRYNGPPILKTGNTECFTVDIMSFGQHTRVPIVA